MNSKSHFKSPRGFSAFRDDWTKRALAVDILVVSAALSALVLLGISTRTAVFEHLVRSRLTFLSILTLGIVLLVSVMIRETLPPARLFLDWIPIIGLFSVYENLKHMHANRITLWLGIEPKDDVMILADKFLFGDVLPLKLESLSQPWLMKVMWIFYILVYYLGPAVLLCWVYFRNRDLNLFSQLRRSLVFGFLGGYLLYIVVPVAGPLFTVGHKFQTPILTQPALTDLAFSFRYNWDCFPSLHTAIPWLITVVAWYKVGRVVRLLCLLCSCGITASTLLLRFHYGIDVIAGLGWATLVFMAVRRLAPAPVQDLESHTEERSNRL